MDKRKTEILNVTRKLINEKGLSNTSTNDIVRELGISRGALYHHFESKDAILDALVEQTSADIYERAREIARDKSVPTVERILKTVMSLSLNSDSEHGVLEHLNSPNNILLHQKVQKEMLITLPCIFAEIVEDGNKEGIFNTDYPYECMETFVSYVTTIFDGDYIEMNEQDALRRLFALICNLERMLGAKEGTLQNFIDTLTKGGENVHKDY